MGMPDQVSAKESSAPGEGVARPRAVNIGREVVCDLRAAERREWLVTNGIGGFASGTVSGNLTRRYHGLLFAALTPPEGRALLVTKLEETASYNDEVLPLFTNGWASGLVDPQGYQHIAEFRLDGGIPVWRFAVADALLDKRVWMKHGANTTYVRYNCVRASGPMQLSIKALVNYRDLHAVTRAEDWHMEISAVDRGLRVLAFPKAVPFYLRSDRAEAAPEHAWIMNFDLPLERERGLEDYEDHLHAATFHGTLNPGESITIVLSTDADAALDGGAARHEREVHELDLLNRWALARPTIALTANDWLKQLVLAADQFIVRRPTTKTSEGSAILAGYHWFGEWARDTMIALPGLLLSTGRAEVAAEILSSYARLVDQGMLPNRLLAPDGVPEYNSVDAALWYFEAVRQHWQATRDTALLDRLFPTLEEIVEWHLRGTRFHIQADTSDGLLYAGEPGVQLTWMDAKVGDHVVTPRMGKPVEVNALWYNAAHSMAGFARTLGKSPENYAALGERIGKGFTRFWNEAAECCFDVIDGPDGNDAGVRPNQILTVSLKESPLTIDQQRAVVDICARRLLTSCGLRSLAPGFAEYQGRYAGAPSARDSAYHQGTVWGWLLGPFALAHLRVYRDPAHALSFLEPMAQEIAAYGLGTLGEIFDGDAPFTPRGCIAQAWTVAEILRAWSVIAPLR
jgi:predicted glycogen debranching enzyme